VVAVSLIFGADTLIYAKLSGWFSAS
jgi:hypothetical protein